MDNVNFYFAMLAVVAVVVGIFCTVGVIEDSKDQRACISAGKTWHKSSDIFGGECR